MRKALYPAILFVGLLGALLGVNPAWPQGICPGPSPCSFEQIGFVDPTLPGRPATLLLVTFCYNTFLGQPLPCGNVFHRIIGLKEPVNQICTDEAVAQGQCTNGGHQHHPETHPVTAPPPNDKFVFENTGLQFDPRLGINTGPVFGTVIVRQQVPEVAGQILYESRVRVSLGARCAFDCFDTFHNRTLLTLHVEVPDLVPMADSGAFHVVVRSDPSKQSHPHGTLGTLKARTLLELIAEDYCRGVLGLPEDVDTGDRCIAAKRRLSINDLSLPKGGLFDLCLTWNPNDKCADALDGGHFEHRAGSEADINSTDEAKVSLSCTGLRKIVMQYFPPSVPLKKQVVKCHPGGGFHVRLD